MTNTEDFDGPDELEPDLDQGAEGEFGDFDEEKKASSIGELVKKNPLVKFGLVAAAIIVVIAAVTIFGGKDEVAPNSVVSANEKTFKDTPGTKELSPEMKNAMEEKNTQRIEEAQKSGGSAITTPIEPPKNLLEVPAEQAATEDPLLRWKQMQEERIRIQRDQQQAEAAAQQDPERDNRLKEMTENMSSQLEAIIGKVPPPQTQHMNITKVTYKKKGPDGGSGSTTMDNVNQLNGAVVQPTVPLVPPKVLLAAGTINYGQTMIEANSDVPGPVLAMLMSGPFSGSKLIGTFQKNEEYLTITFKTMITKKGTSVPIDAYAVDPATSLTGMATEVDHRYFTRIVLPAAAKFVEGMGSAISQQASSTSQSTSSTTTSTDKLDTKQQLGKAVEEASSQISDVLNDDGQKTQILVRVKAGTPIGIMFMQSVTDQTINQARAGFAGNQPGMDPNQQQQQNPYMLQQTGTQSPLQQLQQGFMGQQQGYMYGQQQPQQQQTGNTGYNYTQGLNNLLTGTNTGTNTNQPR